MEERRGFLAQTVSVCTVSVLAGCSGSSDSDPPDSGDQPFYPAEEVVDLLEHEFESAVEYDGDQIFVLTGTLRNESDRKVDLGLECNLYEQDFRVASEGTSADDVRPDIRTEVSIEFDGVSLQQAKDLTDYNLEISYQPPDDIDIDYEVRDQYIAYTERYRFTQSDVPEPVEPGDN